jgi:hypothetical protein
MNAKHIDCNGSSVKPMFYTFIFIASHSHRRLTPGGETAQFLR